MNASPDVIDGREISSTSKPAAVGEHSEDACFLSIVIATRDRGEVIVAALRSLLDDEYPSYEIIVVDQSEDPRTSSALLPYLDDDRLRYFRVNGRGVSRGRNYGISRAQGEWIGIIDDDCVVPTGWLRKLAEVSRSDEATGVAFGNVLPGPHDPEAGFIPAYIRGEPFLARSIRDKLEVEGLSACMAVRRDVWHKLNGFDEELGVGASMRSGAETDFTMRALLAGYAVYETPAWTLTHHGFRTTRTEGLPLIDRYWYGTGSVFSKLIKCGHTSVAVLLFRLAARWLTGRSRVSASLGAYGYRWLRLAAFVRGFIGGLMKPVDRGKGPFTEKFISR